MSSGNDYDEKVWGAMTKNSAMVISSIGAILAVGAAVYVFAFPNEKLGRGVVTMFALFTILIACAYVYTTNCVREGKCYVWSYVYAFLTLAMGILSVVYACTSKVITPAFVYPNSQQTINRFMDGDRFMVSPAEPAPSPAASVKSASMKQQKKKKRVVRK